MSSSNFCVISELVVYDYYIDFLSLADSGLTHQAIQGDCSVPNTQINSLS